MWQTVKGVLASSWQQVADQASVALPNVLAGAAIFLIGVVIAVAAGRVAGWLLSRAKVDRAANRLGLLGPLSRIGVTSLAMLVGRVLKWTIIALAFVPALDSLDPGLAADLVHRAILYVPRVVVALAILWVAFLVSRFVSRGVLIGAVNAGFGAARPLALFARWAVLIVAIAAAFEHLGIGRATILTAFAILFGGVTLAAALAVGLGSQDLVRAWLTRHGDHVETTQRADAIRHW